MSVPTSTDPKSSPTTAFFVTRLIIPPVPPRPNRSALLFGRGGTGGIINRVTKKAVVGEDFGSVDVGTDTFGSLDLAFDYNVSGTDDSAFRINVHTDSLARESVCTLILNAESSVPETL